ncbi:MAG: glutamine--tRNA ligase/YqeY domain fusion protein [Planctomycetota bacterium]
MLRPMSPDRPDRPDSRANPSESQPTKHFIQQAIDADVAAGKWGPAGDRSVVTTRFPPEPNGYMHIGHAKAVVLSFGLAHEHGGRCYLRFDDTNPEKEEAEYVRSIIRDIRWLGGDWTGCDPDNHESEAGVTFASDYFERMYAWACELITKGLAYVDEQTAEQIKASRGGPGKADTPSPWRDRPAEESLDLFARMKAGEFTDGSRVLRAKIDLAASNFNLRDPVMYRVVNRPHHRTGSAWHIYPMYDWAHGLEDSIENVTHSICTLEFEDHRPLYDWFINAINRGRQPERTGSGPGAGGERDAANTADRLHHAQQIEFSRLEPTYIVTSKRKLKQLVDDGRVTGWDDPRMPTVSGLRRRGCTPEALRAFSLDTGVTKFKAVHDLGLFEGAQRAHLNKVAPRRLAVLRPLKVTITNWDETLEGPNLEGHRRDADGTEWMDAVNNPEDEAAGTRLVTFTRELYIEREDFMEDAPKKFFRLKPGGEVRLRYAYWITCNEVIKDDAGEVIELRCTYDPHTRGGDNPPPDAEGKVRKVKGTLHWVSAQHAINAEVRLFDRLFTEPQPGKKTGDPLDDLNPDSLEVIEAAKLEPALASRTDDEPNWPDGIRRYQFERHGYFCVDEDAAPDRPIFNRTVTLKDSWAKAAAK